MSSFRRESANKHAQHFYHEITKFRLRFVYVDYPLKMNLCTCIVWTSRIFRQFTVLLYSSCNYFACLPEGKFARIIIMRILLVLYDANPYYRFEDFDSTFLRYRQRGLGKLSPRYFVYILKTVNWVLGKKYIS
jgi:hypothetical protein